MKIHKLGGACVVIAVLVAMAVAASAHANVQSPAEPALPTIVALPSLDPVTSAEVEAVASLGIPLPRAREAVAVQSAVERNGLVVQLEASLGEAFGGVWYEPAAAQLQVGVTSPGAARVAEAVALRAGLGSSVTETVVRSSEAELRAAQEWLDRRVAGLLARGEATTWPSVEDNAVYVDLGSEVPAGERAALEDEASAGSVEVVVTRASNPKLRVVPQAQCRKFATDKAFCDPTIVAGTSLESFGAAKKEPICTVGPAVAQLKGSTELYVLTAGHCVKKAGESFFSLNKEGTKTEEIGKVAAFLNEGSGNDADIAAIKIENAFWKKAGEIPVIPNIAPWDATKEVEPFRVKGEVAPAVKATTCISGQTSGFKCGVIKAINLTGGKRKELVEVEKTKTLEGDSGGPWFVETTKLVQGTHVGENEENGNPIYQALQWGFKRLKEVSKLELELLQEANEKRM